MERTIAIHQEMIKSQDDYPLAFHYHSEDKSIQFRDRRKLLSNILRAATTAMMCCSMMSQEVAVAEEGETVSIKLNSHQDRLGLELYDVIIGTNRRPVVAVKSVQPRGLGSRRGVKGGMVLNVNGGFTDAKSIVERIRSGPYPIYLTFKSLAAGGDVLGDLQKPLISPEEALDAAKSNDHSVTTPSTKDEKAFVARALSIPSSCSIKTRRLDIVEINYIARYGSNKQGGRELVIYDSSKQRGTGLPFQFVLGSGDMIKGVDLGTMDMCPGEVRELEIPAALGYGARGAKIFGIPPDAKLFWTIELVSVNSIREGDERSREDMESRD